MRTVWIAHSKVKREPPIAGSTPACRNICQGSSADRARMNVFRRGTLTATFKWNFNPVVVGSSPTPGNLCGSGEVVKHSGPIKCATRVPLTAMLKEAKPPIVGSNPTCRINSLNTNSTLRKRCSEVSQIIGGKRI